MTQPTNLEIQSRIRAESEQISQEFGGLDANLVARCVDAAKGRVADARVQDFTPIFFARRARRLIREAIASTPPRPAHA